MARAPHGGYSAAVSKCSWRRGNHRIGHRAGDTPRRMRQPVNRAGAHRRPRGGTDAGFGMRARPHRHHLRPQFRRQDPTGVHRRRWAADSCCRRTYPDHQAGRCSGRDQLQLLRLRAHLAADRGCRGLRDRHLPGGALARIAGLGRHPGGLPGACRLPASGITRWRPGITAGPDRVGGDSLCGHLSGARCEHADQRGTTGHPHRDAARGGAVLGRHRIDSSDRPVR
ncbi:Uncharacterised protein [Mycobacteroides abscessus subsp. abscessus]|nr:Uncharacterised protein [Mycobacteroides abscessus subsp. abscessus]